MSKHNFQRLEKKLSEYFKNSLKCRNVENIENVEKGVSEMFLCYFKLEIKFKDITKTKTTY